MTDLRILEAPGQREQLWPLSAEAYHALGDAGLIPEKTELLGGFVFRKMPKSPLHRAILQRLLEHLARVIDGTKFWLQSEQPITCRDSEPEPDISVVAGSNEDFLDRHPHTAELVVGIAINSQEMDRAKAAIYAEAGVKEYWLVDVPAGAIEIYSVPQATGYAETKTVMIDGMASSVVFPGFSVAVAQLLAR